MCQECFKKSHAFCVFLRLHNKKKKTTSEHYYFPPDKEWEKIKAEKAKIRNRFDGLFHKLIEKDCASTSASSAALKPLAAQPPTSALIQDVTDEVGAPTGANPSGITSSAQIVLRKPEQHLTERGNPASTAVNASAGRSDEPALKKRRTTDKDADLRNVLAALKNGGKLEDVVGSVGDRDVLDALKDDGTDGLLGGESDEEMSGDEGAAPDDGGAGMV